MEVAAILSLLPDDLLDELAIQTNVNYYSKKLQGQVIFKLLIYCIISYKDNSLRTMESAYESVAFNMLNRGVDSKKVRYSSISERLSNIEPSYFEQLYQRCVTIYRKQLEADPAVMTRFDSTIVSLSGKLLKTGYHLKGGDADHVRQLKFTIGYETFPVTAHFFREQKYTSENIALKEAILSWQPDKENTIKIFDKGITARKAYDELTEKKVPFISRVGEQCKHEQCLPNTLQKALDTPTLTITSDSWSYLFSSHKKRSAYPVRLIHATIKKSGAPVVFVTNVSELPAEMIAQLYKRRWDIEVFFKFLKQHLNFSHLVNRSENGIQVMFYTTMIASILLMVYKKSNNLTGYKIVKQKFVQHLETALIKDIVFLCGGDPEKVNQIIRKSPQ